MFGKDSRVWQWLLLLALVHAPAQSFRTLPAETRGARIHRGAAGKGRGNGGGCWGQEPGGRGGGGGEVDREADGTVKGSLVCRHSSVLVSLSCNR